MANFKNINELKKYFEKNKATVNSNDYMPIVNREIEKLKSYIEHEILVWYSKYKPSAYIRTYNWINSLRIEPAKVVGSKITAKIYFDDSIAWHESWVTNKKEDEGYVPWLWEVGWSWHNRTGPYLFARFEGIHAIKNAVERFNKDNKLGVQIEVYYNNKKYI